MTRFAVLVEVALAARHRRSARCHHRAGLAGPGLRGISGVRAGKAFRFVVDAADEDVGPIGGRGSLPPAAGQPGDRGLRRCTAGAGAVTARVGVVLFPGSNCEYDVVEALRSARGRGRRSCGTATGRSVALDAVVLPGGFAHGDYLRPGAIARFSPIMAAVAAFAAEGGPVVGICNGFQVLTEAHLLPGALQKNRGLTFSVQHRRRRGHQRSERPDPTGSPAGTRLRIPINHFEGNYTCDAATLAELRRDERIVLRYVDNPNGSVDDIAGICNEAGNVVGLMPHPERASDPLLGSTDGLVLCSRSLLASRRPASPQPRPGDRDVASVSRGCEGCPLAAGRWDRRRRPARPRRSTPCARRTPWPAPTNAVLERFEVNGVVS